MPPAAECTFCTESCVIEITVPTRADGSDTWKAGGVLQAASSSAKAAVNAAAPRRQYEVWVMSFSNGGLYSGIEFSRNITASSPVGRPSLPSHCSKMASMSPLR